MNKEELYKQVDHELNWLRYYGYREDRESVDLEQDTIYEQIRSIGYTKRVTPLDVRCIGYLCFEYQEGMSVEELEPISSRRNPEEKQYSPLEIWLKLYPQDKDWVFERLTK